MIEEYAIVPLPSILEMPDGCSNLHTMTHPRKLLCQLFHDSVIFFEVSQAYQQREKQRLKSDNVLLITMAKARSSGIEAVVN